MSAPPLSSAAGSRRLWLSVAACLLLASTAAGQEPSDLERIFDLPPRLAAFLRGPAGLSYGDLVLLRRGELVTRELALTRDHEAAFISVAAVDAVTRERFRRGALAGDLIMDRPDVLAWGRFGEPPRPPDLVELRWDDQDFQVLSQCVERDCKVKLGADGIRTLRSGVDFDSPRARAEATDLLRRYLLERLLRYRHAGNAGLGIYVDKDYPLQVGEEAADLVRRSPFLSRHAPALQEYLLDFPVAELAGAADVFLWSKENLGTKRHVTSMQHGVVWEPPAGDDADVLLVTKQLYANHYFEGELGIILLVPAPGYDVAGTGGGEAPHRGRRAWLVHVYRGRLDVLRGFGLFHGRVRSGVWGQVDRRMRQWREWLESTGPVGGTRVVVPDGEPGRGAGPG